VGRFALDETLVHRISAYLTGRVDAVHVPLEGNRIEAGAPLVDFSSAELASLHAELKSAGALGEAVKTAVTERLRRAGLTDAQIGELEKQPNPVQRITLLTPVGGVVTERAVRPGMFVKDGDLFAAVASFDRLVLDVDVFEKDLARVAPGVQARVTVDALPGDSFEGTVASVKPFLDAETRTAQARILVDNRGGRAMPGMYARVELRIPLGADGRPLSSAATAPAGSLYACPMRCVPAGPEPGKCPKCGMALKRLDDAEAAAERQPLLVPVTAVLGFGRRQLVYVETRELHYEPREVTTGPRIGSDVMILTGLRAGEKVVARGALLVDSQTQIEGRESLIRTEARPGEGSRPAGHGGHR
jgi:Cu(I)/Ag(I) efflux system membrane fusion protein